MQKDNSPAEAGRSPTDAPADATQKAETPEEPDAPAQLKKKMKPGQVISSVFAAGLGVQSSKNRERDFSEGSAGTFIAAGLIFTALFIGGLYLLVQIVLKSA